MTIRLPVSRLWELYDYNPFTGYLISKLTGKQVRGSINKNGYRYILVVYKGKRIATRHSRAVFAWCGGSWPIQQIDHKDRNRLNDRIHNLADVSCRQNNQNKQTFSGGAYYDKARNKWLARIYANGKRKHLGRFATEEQARAAYSSAVEALVGE